MSSLVVDTNLSAMAANNALNATDSQMTKAITELSTGLSIQTAADGPAAYVIVDSIEASVGAVQNQLQAIAANLTVGQQNLTAANSQLVNVNMAQEMTTFSTDQILMQTGTSMLAQAQQAPQLVLKLT